MPFRGCSRGKGRNAGGLGDVTRGSVILRERSGRSENEARSDPLVQQITEGTVHS